MAIRWHDQPYHPGRYRVRFLSPVHNGYRENEVFESVGFWDGGWDEYEDFLLDWCRGTKANPILSKRAVILAAWEMFLISHDGPLAAVIHSDRMFKTVDDSIGVETRYTHLQDVSSYLASHHPMLYNAWDQMKSYINNYSYWLGHLVRKEASAQEVCPSPDK